VHQVFGLICDEEQAIMTLKELGDTATATTSEETKASSEHQEETRQEEETKTLTSLLPKKSSSGFLSSVDGSLEERGKGAESPSNSTADVTLTPDNPLYVLGERSDQQQSQQTTSPSRMKNSTSGLSALDTLNDETISNTPDEDHLRHNKPRSPSGDYGQLENLDFKHEEMMEQQTPSFLPPATPEREHHQYHLLRQIQEDSVCDDIDEPETLSSDRNSDSNLSALSSEQRPLQSSSLPPAQRQDPTHFEPQYASTQLVYRVCNVFFTKEDFCHATWIGFWALFQVTCANYVLSPMRDAAALQVGVKHMPKLTLASSLLAFVSSVPIGWLFEAPDPGRRKVWKRMGLTRGETQGTSLALFYRCFALSLLSYAVGFVLVDLIKKYPKLLPFTSDSFDKEYSTEAAASIISILWSWTGYFFSRLGQFMYIAFFLVVHLMKLHSLSLVWGVTTEAMEYEDVARKGFEQKRHQSLQQPKKSKTRLQRLSLVGFGGTLGGILGR
jgi:hypothetical protein